MDYLECVKEAEKCSAIKLQELINNLPNGETKSNIDKLIKFINYSKTDLSKEFFNALEFVNINEDKNKEFFTNRKSINEKIGLQIGARGNIDFYYKLSAKIDITELLCRYIEYFELHSDVGDYYDNLPGYTKIVDGKFIYKVCCELYDDDIYKNLPKDIQLLINNIKNIDEIVWMSA